jgi:predicted TIM-barrel fold metal-dependent hydrolase
MKLNVVDAQVHGNKIGRNWLEAPLEETLTALVAAMDAVGVQGVIIDEAVGQDRDYHHLPGHVDDDGFWRPDRPFSELAVATFGERFRYLWRMDRLDPRLRELMADFHSAPGRIAIRVLGREKAAIWTDPAFTSGGYNEFFELAEEHQVPLFIMMMGRPETLAPYARRFPDLLFIMDHIGIAWPEAGEPAETRYRCLEPVLRLSEHPNVAIKWCHIERLAAEPYPFRDAMPHFRRVVDAYGAERIMWASDATQTTGPPNPNYPTATRHLSTWGELLHCVLDTELFSAREKEQMLGGTARKLLRW